MSQPASGDHGLPQIVRDEGPAGGNASFTQRVRVRRHDGFEYTAYAKFLRATDGSNVVECGERGLASELLASRLGQAVGVPISSFAAVELPHGMVVELRDKRRPAPGLAVASEAIIDKDGNDPSHVVGSEMLDPVSDDNVALIAAFEMWVQAQDRNNTNLIVCDDTAYTIDHPTAFAAGWAGPDPARPIGQANPNLAPRLDNGAMQTAAKAIEEIPDEAIEDALADIPAEWATEKDKGQLRDQLLGDRQRVADSIRERYPSSEPAI